MDEIKIQEVQDGDALMQDGASVEINPMIEAEIAEPDGDPQEVDELPAWVKMPPGMVVPRGKTPVFMLFRKEWTDTPHKGDRQCILWTLNVADEKLAHQRAGASGETQALNELSKRCIRAIDGGLPDWTGKDKTKNLDAWWDEIGAKCRQMIINYYLRSHTMSLAERVDFFGHCVVARASV